YRVLRPEERAEDERRASFLGHNAYEILFPLVLANLRSELNGVSAQALASEALDVLRAFFDQDADTRKALEEVKDVAEDLPHLLGFVVKSESEQNTTEFAEQITHALSRSFVGRWTNEVQRGLIPLERHRRVRPRATAGLV